VQLEPRVMAVLVQLAERPGEVVTRDALLVAVGGGTIVQEEALTHAISRLRHAFGDDPRAPRYIETIPKRGYRLVAEVAPDDTAETSPPGLLPRGPRGHPPWAGLIFIATLLVVFFFAVRREWRPDSPTSPALLAGAPLTSYPGREAFPTVSPDGTRIAFAWNGDEEEGADLYVVQRGAERPLRLTDAPGRAYLPCWSPDGTHLAFLHDAVEGGTVVRVVPSLGGAPRTLLESAPDGIIDGLDWHPTDEWLVVSLATAAEAPRILHRLSADGGPPAVLFPPPADYAGDTLPALSPDGTRVAFLRGDGFGFTDVHVADLDGDHVQRLTFGQGRIRGLDWRADGKAVVFSSGTAFSGEFRLWSVDVETAELTWLPTRGTRSIHPSVAADAGVLVYAEEKYHRHLVHTVLDPASEAEGEPQPFVRSSASEYDAHHSPSGERVAFVSTRSGHPEIWICGRDGADARRVTSFGGAHREFLQWSRDERFLAYDAMTGSRSAIHVTDVEQGTTRPLTATTENQVLLSWSRDDTHVYYQALIDAEWHTMRAAVATGEVEKVLPFRTHMLAESADGTSLVYVKTGPAAVWRADRDGANESLLFEDPQGVLQCYWKATPEGILFYRKRDGRFRLAFRGYRDDAAQELLPLPAVRWGLLDVSMDGRSFLYDQLDRVETDLVVVESLP